MTLAEVSDHIAYWERFPPPHLALRMLAMAMAGWKPPAARFTPSKPSSQADVAAFVEAVTGGGIHG